ncbi:MAG: alginate export family protein [Ignavibacteriaceae bacterium]
MRFGIAPEKYEIDVFALTVRESVSYIGNANPFVYPYPQEPTPSTSIYGFWKRTKFDDSNKLDVFGYWEINRFKVGGDTCILNMPTFGGSYWGTFGRVSTIFEAAYQFGDFIGRDISAYLLSASAYYKVGTTKVGVGADILSGTNPYDESTKMNTFQATYGTNHKFYGYMDYFINIPVNTMNLGLNDFYITSDFNPDDSIWSFSVNIHQFMSNKSTDLTLPGNSSPSSEKTFGQEIDLTVKYAFVKGTTLVWGGSVFFPGGLMKYAFAPREDMAYWTYVIIVANF